MEEKIALIGIFLIFLGIFLVLIGSVLNQKVRVEWGFFGLIGPIPIGAWSSKTAFILTVSLLLLFLLIIIILKW